MAGLGTLEVELLAAILEFVDDESPSTSLAVLQVNRHLYGTAQLVAHRRKEIDLFRANYEAKVARWLGDSNILRSIRHLKVVGRDDTASAGHSIEQFSKRWSQLSQLIESLSNLKTLSVSVAEALPVDVIEALQNHHPRAKLSIFNFTRQHASAKEREPTEIALAKSPNLTMFHMDNWRGSAGRQAFRDDDLREPAFKRIVASAPNLRVASITAAPIGRARQVDEKVEALFYTHTKPNTSVRHLSLDGYAMTRITLEDWSKVVDLSQLESLKSTRGLPRVEYFQAAPRILKNLKSISFNLAFNHDPAFATALETYLSSCSALSSISLWSWMHLVSLSTILKHGPSLTFLELRERESPFHEYERGLLTVQDLEEIREACPILESFTMDVDRQQESFEEDDENLMIYNELAEFTALKKVQIYLDICLARQSAFDYPDSDDDAASSAGNEDEESGENAGEEADGGLTTKKKQKKSMKGRLPVPTNVEVQRLGEFLWKKLFGSRRTGLRALDIKVGEWERKWRGGHHRASWEEWEDSQKKYFLVRPNVRDDMLGECIFKEVARDRTE